ncbi:unnamed protein product [Effrenium voratum]|nr:unnamed protein product [Effrenium voratum]
MFETTPLSYDDRQYHTWGTVGSLGLLEKPFTFMGWAHIRRNLGGHHPMFSISTVEDGNTNDGLGARAGQGLFFDLQDPKGSYCKGGYNRFDQGWWTHFAWSYDPTEKRAYMYRDGKMEKNSGGIENGLTDNLLVVCLKHRQIQR